MSGLYSLKPVPDESDFFPVFIRVDEEFWAVGECGSVGLWLSANLRGIKDSVPLTTLCTATAGEGHIQKKKCATKILQCYQKPCNVTKNRAMVPKTMQQHKNRATAQKMQQHKNRATAQKLCKSTKNHAIAQNRARAQKPCNGTKNVQQHKNCATAPKTVQQHQKLCKSTNKHSAVPNKNARLLKNCATAPKILQQHQKRWNGTKKCAPKTAHHLITNSGMSSAPHCKGGNCLESNIALAFHLISCG